MTGNEIFTNLVPVLAPVLTGSMGVLGILIKDRRREKNLDHQLRRQVEAGRAQVEFIHAWIQARQLLGPLGEDARPAQEWLDRCYAAVRNSQRSRRRAESPKRIPALRRFLLIRPLHGATAQVWRIFYWLLFLVCNIYVVASISGIVALIQGHPDGGDTAIGAGVFAAVFAALAGAARVISVHHDQVKPFYKGYWGSGITGHSRDKSRGQGADKSPRSAVVPHWPSRTPHDHS